MKKEYDELLQIIEQCITKVSYEEICHCDTLLMIAINEEVRLQRCVEHLLEHNHDLKIVFVAQPAMEPVIKEWYGTKYSVVVWQGRYTVDLLKQIDISAINGFLYFTEQAVNMRDDNFTGIVEVMNESDNVRIFSNTIGEDLYEYSNLGLYNHAIRVYNAVNDLMDYLPQGKDKV